MDPYAPATANYQPQKSMSLPDMLGMAKSVQDYQQTQRLNPLVLQREQQAVEQARQMNPLLLQQQSQAAQTGKMALDIDAAKFNEQHGIQQFMSNKDNYLDRHGDVDMNRVMTTVPKLFPFLGTDLVNKLSEMSKNQSVSQDAKMGLTQKQRGLFANTLIDAANSGATTLDHFKQSTKMLQEAMPGVDFTALANSYWKNLEAMGVGPGKDVRQLMLAGAATLKGEGATRYTEEYLKETSPSGRRLIKITDKYTGKINIVEDTSADPIQSEISLQTDDYKGRPIASEIPATLSGDQVPGETSPGEPWKLGPDVRGRGVTYPERPGVTPAVREQQSLERAALTQSIQPSRQILGDVETVRNYIPFAITGGLADWKANLSKWYGALNADEKARFVKTATDVANKSLARLRGSIFAGKTGQSAELLKQIEAGIPGLEANPEAIMIVMDQLETAAHYPILLDRAMQQAVKHTHTKDKPYLYLDTMERFNEVSDLKTLEWAAIHERSRSKEDFLRNAKLWADRQGISREEMDQINKQYTRLELLLDGDILSFEKSRVRKER